MLYDALAPIYDRIMNHVAYEEWIRLIERVIEKYAATRAPSILELGGGTGVLAGLLMRRGFRCVVTDRSFAMCSEAHRRKAAPAVCADALAIPAKGPFDLMLFLYDGINYLQSLDEYEHLFAEAARCLAPGGLFLFDITTEANSMHHFLDYLECDDWGDYAYIRRSYYNRDTRQQHNDITIFRQIGEDPRFYEKFVEHHSQRVFSAQAIAGAVPVDHFSIQGIWDGYSFREHRSQSERIHFLLKKHAL